ncbi:high frequency lysogenization protein HflD [Pusillimonas caeni]|nr:high frequency lysogenization protein HflD [Pusillimonas caeni]
MRIETGRGFRALALCAMAMAVAMLAWAFLSGHPSWSRFLAWLMATQAELHRQLASGIRLVAQEGWAAAGPLMGISLLYGIFHAAGPGHGKAVIATYLGTSRTRLRRGVLLSLLSALVQGAVAVALVEVVAGLLGYSLRRAQSAGMHMENLSFALIAVLGSVLALKCGGALYRRRRRPRLAAGSLLSGTGRMRAYCADCGGLHRLTDAHTARPLTWRSGLAIVLAIGMRPCTGAVLMLLVAYSLGLRWAGIAAVLAMSLGTAVTVSLLAAATVWFRQAALRVLRQHASADGRIRPVFDVLGLVGGLMLCAMGIGLLRQGLAAGPHPFL